MVAMETPPLPPPSFFCPFLTSDCLPSPQYGCLDTGYPWLLGEDTLCLAPPQNCLALYPPHHHKHHKHKCTHTAHTISSQPHMPITPHSQSINIIHTHNIIYIYITSTPHETTTHKHQRHQMHITPHKHLIHHTPYTPQTHQLHQTHTINIHTKYTIRTPPHTH